MCSCVKAWTHCIRAHNIVLSLLLFVLDSTIKSCYTIDCLFKATDELNAILLFNENTGAIFDVIWLKTSVIPIEMCVR